MIFCPYCDTGGKKYDDDDDDDDVDYVKEEPRCQTYLSFRTIAEVKIAWIYTSTLHSSWLGVYLST